jgi:hypothetical protein
MEGSSGPRPQMAILLSLFTVRKRLVTVPDSDPNEVLVGIQRSMTSGSFMVL